jgi:transcriptional regulator with XRE-family HTH domain
MSVQFGDNLRFMRKRKKRSQEEVADAVEVTRSSLSGYELGNSEPPYDALLRLSDYFHIPVDFLLRQDLAKISELDLDAMERGLGQSDLSGKKLRVLATTVNSDNEENIELVPHSAKAGYTNGFADPEFISILPAFQMPFLSKEKKYRTFPISGDSMPPVADGSWVTGEYVQNWNLIREGMPYIVITLNEGIVFKNVINNIKENGTLLLCSTNPIYEPYSIPVSEVLEVWKFVHFISSEMQEVNSMKDELTIAVVKLQKEVAQLRMKFE